MKVIKKSIVLMGLVIYIFFSCNSQSRSNNQDGDEILMSTILAILNEVHFVKKNINKEFFNEVLEKYFNLIDREKLFFTKSEYEEIKALNTFENDYSQIRKIFPLVDKILDGRGKKVRESAIIYLEKDLDFTKNEFYETDYKKKKWLENEVEIIKDWKKKLKNNVLNNIFTELEKKENKLVKFRDPKFKALEKEAREEAIKSVKRIFNEIINQRVRDTLNDYLLALTTSYDRHTVYLPPVERGSFDFNVSGKLEGIGAQINKADDGYIEIISIVPGGPSSKQKELIPGDKILKVGQGEDSKLIDVSSLTINESLGMIRGKKGSKVRLLIRKSTGEEKEISIIRDIIIWEESYARSTVFQKDQENYGYLYLPAFYRDFKKSNARNSSDDVKKEIEYLKNLNIKGLVFDLRDNGGGSLQDAVAISGFFIKSGPIVRVRSNKGEHAPLYDRDAKVIFEKPLIFLINENSASASEILSAAMQDYDRALVMGTKKSFGKGTVQSVFDLNNISGLNKFDRDFGSIKFTAQKFYRITGQSTQNIGVKPDIIFPSLLDTLKPRETDFPYDFLESIEFEKWDKPSTKSPEIEKIVDKTIKEINQIAYFQKIKKRVLIVEEEQQQTLLSLQFKKRMGKRKKFFKKINELDEKIKTPFTDFKPIFDKRKETNYSKEWYETLSTDIELNEAFKVLEKLSYLKLKK